MQNIIYLYFRTEPNTIQQESNFLQQNLRRIVRREFTEEEMVTYYVAGKIAKLKRGYV